MYRFFVPPHSISRDRVVITGDLARRLRSVLRLGPGEHVVVLDNSGWEYEVELKSTGTREVEGVIVGRSPCANEPQMEITLYQALLKGSSFELVLQKCTEIGVTGFVPVVCERCVAAQPAGSRVSRWRAIIAEAAQQSRRGKLPSLQPSMPFQEACDAATGIALLPWEGETATGIGDMLRSRKQADSTSVVSIFVGPEGGFSDDEVELARNRGVAPVSLGRRVLRAETAGLVAAAIVLHEFGEMNGSG